jgi:hypothetical protein
VKPLRPRGHILTTMNLRPAGGTLRPGGHIIRTMNLRRGCRPVISAASRRRRSRAPTPVAPPATSAPPVGPPPGNRSAPPGFPRDSAPDLSVVLSPPPRRMARGAPDRPRSVTGGSLLGAAGIFTGAPTGSAQTGGPAPGADRAPWLYPVGSRQKPPANRHPRAGSGPAPWRLRSRNFSRS